MRKFLIASHGQLANGLKHTLKLFIGNVEQYSTLCAYDDDVKISSQIEEFDNDLSTDDELVILTDILGGSVNQELTNKYSVRENTHLIAGCNLPLLLELTVLPEDEAISEQQIRDIVERCQRSIVYVNDVLRDRCGSEDDE